MKLEQFVNNASTTLNGSINNTDSPVTLVLTSATGFPSDGNFRLIIDNEILLCTAISGTSCTCSRAQEGTTIASHSNGATVTHVLTVASLLQLLMDRAVPGRGAPCGFHLEWLTSTTISIAPGETRDKTGAASIVLPSLTTMDITSSTYQDVTIDTTAVVTHSSTAVTAGTALLTAFGTRALTGTYTTVGTVGTGSSSKFLSELAVGDLIGDATKGYSRVTAVASDTAFTLTVALPNGDATARSGNVIENPTIGYGGTNACVKSITSNSVATLTEAFTGSTSPGGVAIGGHQNNASTVLFYHVWVAFIPGNSVTVVFSTQRTSLFGGQYNRRVGSIVDNGTTIIEFNQTGDGIDKTYAFECAYDAYAMHHVVNVVTPTSNTWTDALCSVCLPPTAYAASITNGLPANSTILAFRRRLTGSSSTKRLKYLYQAVGAVDTQYLPNNVILDGVQAFQYAVNGTSAVDIYVRGYSESLRN